MPRLFKTRSRSEDENWVSVSDLMAGLMMIFLLIAISYVKDADKRATAIQNVVTTWQQQEQEIYDALYRQFKDDLPGWNAIIEKDTLTIRFNSPKYLFKTDSAELTDKFKSILSDFMPRYLELLHENFEAQVAEVRIEGHTSSEWGDESGNLAFIKNMDLSQARTRSVLNFSLSINRLDKIGDWIRKTVSANGLSSAQVIYNNGVEDRRMSRRVEFSIRTKTRETLKGVLEEISPSIENKI